MKPQTIIISRTDSIGDVVLTLPMCGVLKAVFPTCKIVFLAKAYTQAVVESCVHVDQFLNWDEMRTGSPSSQMDILKSTGADTIVHVFPRKEILWVAKRAGIAVRIATGRRLYTIGKCNKLVFFSRKGSNLHEAQLNVKLLRPLGVDVDYSLDSIINFYGFSKLNDAAEKKVATFFEKFDPSKRKIILHPLSKGSAVEWSLANFQLLIDLMPKEKYDVFISGTSDEGAKIRASLPLTGSHVHDITGVFSLTEFISFIRHADALVAASTGPLHIAAAAGIHAVGLFSPKRPIHPERWAPLGKNATFIVAASHPQKGQKLAISPDEVLKVLSSF